MALMPVWRGALLATMVALAACTTGKKVAKAGASADAGVSTAVKADPADLLETERRAAAVYANGQYELAVPLYRTLVESMPMEAEYWYRLGNSLARTGHPNDAAVAYEQTLVRDPDNARAWHNLGVARLLQAQMSFAEGVKNSRSGEPVFDESLRLSTAIFSLTAADGQQKADPQAGIRQVPAIN